MARESSKEAVLSGGALASLRRALLAWYRRCRRDMPWRRTRDPYRIWVSEVMLQQTQVATATPYYERFVKHFPDVVALADAPLDDVLAAWAGLGYYRRARFLHEAARVVAREHGGRVPVSPDAFAALPGVGRYTVGAVLSISLGSRLPVLDGNVGRVLARWTARPLQAKRPADAAILWKMAESLLPPAGGAANPGDWNQALMELGATVCTPRAPRCAECPVRAHCRAHALGTPEAFPPVAARREAVKLRRAVALLRRGEQVLLERRTGELLDGLWEPPGVDVPEGGDAGALLRARLRALGVHARIADGGRRVGHTITHRTIEVEVWEATGAATARARAGLKWCDAAAPAVGVSAMAKKVLRG
ncbi:MAG: A/G-specific adenine glycosylase [Candidatus Eisenbacteria bacterium]